MQMNQINPRQTSKNSFLVFHNYYCIVNSVAVIFVMSLLWFTIALLIDRTISIFEY